MLYHYTVNVQYWFAREAQQRHSFSKVFCHIRFFDLQILSQLIFAIIPKNHTLYIATKDVYSESTSNFLIHLNLSETGFPIYSHKKGCEASLTHTRICLNSQSRQNSGLGSLLGFQIPVSSPDLGRLRAGLADCVQAVIAGHSAWPRGVPGPQVVQGPCEHVAPRESLNP